MLRMKFGQGSDAIVIRLEGHFVRDFAKHALQLIANSKRPSVFIADLTALSYIDAVGEEALTMFKDLGVRFKADSEVSRYICDRLELPVMGEQATSSPRRCSTGKRDLVPGVAHVVCESPSRHRNG